jgi:predicted alpha-1,6-mannanase (GH76 family)
MSCARETCSNDLRARIPYAQQTHRRLKNLARFLVALLVFDSASLPVKAADDLLAKAALTTRIADGIGVLNRLYWSPTLGIWLDQPGDDLRAHYDGRRNPPWWSSANAVEVLLDFMKVTGTADYAKTVETLYDLNKDLRTKPPRVIAELKRRGQWTEADEQKLQRRREKAATAEPAATEAVHYVEFRNEYLDDSGWWGITWLKMYDRTREQKYLATAKAIHAHMAKNWRPEKGGGVLWTEGPDKLIPNAITNSLFLILSARLYQRTQEPAYLRWAEQTLEWQRAQALFDGRGVVDVPGHQGDYWTYNQGTFIGGRVALYEATGKAAYLDEAVKVADAILHQAGLVTPDGVIIEKLGTKGWDVGLFKGVLARYLGQLRGVLNARRLHPELAQQLDDCVRRSAASLIEHSSGADGQYGIEWQEGGRDQTRNFNTHVAALAALVAVLPDAKP